MALVADTFESSDSGSDGHSDNSIPIMLKRKQTRRISMPSLKRSLDLISTNSRSSSEDETPPVKSLPKAMKTTKSSAARYIKPRKITPSNVLKEKNATTASSTAGKIINGKENVTPEVQSLPITTSGQTRSATSDLGTPTLPTRKQTQPRSINTNSENRQEDLNLSNQLLKKLISKMDRQEKRIMAIEEKLNSKLSDNSSTTTDLDSNSGRKKSIPNAIRVRVILIFGNFVYNCLPHCKSEVRRVYRMLMEEDLQEFTGWTITPG